MDDPPPAALGCEYAGVSYANLRSKGIETGAASHEVLRQGDAAQREVGEGPCLQAMRDGSVDPDGAFSVLRRYSQERT